MHRVIVVGRGTPPYRAPRAGSCLTLRKELSEETRADKARDFIGKGDPRGEQQGKGTQENCSAAWLAMSGFMVMGLVSRWSLANHSNSESFLVVQASLSQSGCQREGFWEVDGHVVSPFDLFWTLPVGGGLLIPYSLLGSPVIKQLMQMVWCLAWVGGFNQCASPNIITMKVSSGIIPKGESLINGI